MDVQPIEESMTIMDFLDHVHALKREYNAKNGVKKPEHDLQYELDNILKFLLPYHEAPRVYTVEQGVEGTHSIIWVTRTVKEWDQLLMEAAANIAAHKIAKKLGIEDMVESGEVRILDVQVFDGEDDTEPHHGPAE